MTDRLLPRYQHIKDDILAKISEGFFEVGTQLPTEQQLAENYGVSRPTIRHALTVLQNEGHLDRVQGKGTFVSTPSLDKIPAVASRTVGFIVPRLADVFVGRIITGAQEILSDGGYYVSVFITSDSPQKERAFIEEMLDKDVAGLMIHPTTAEYYNPIMYHLRDRKMPFVMTARHYRYLDCSFVEADHYNGAYSAVQYLVDMGHRNIGLVSKPPLIKSSIKDRINGYFDALSDNDISIHHKLILTDLSDTRSAYWDERNEDEISVVDNQLRRYLERSPEMTAVIALNDLIAADLIRLIREYRKEPGRDVSVIGFDNVSFCERLDPPLTTVECRMVDVGREAARILLEQIKDPDLPPQKLHLPTKIIARQSCSPVTL